MRSMLSLAIVGRVIKENIFRVLLSLRFRTNCLRIKSLKMKETLALYSLSLGRLEEK